MPECLTQTGCTKRIYTQTRAGMAHAWGRGLSLHAPGRASGTDPAHVARVDHDDRGEGGTERAMLAKVKAISDVYACIWILRLFELFSNPLAVSPQLLYPFSAACMRV